MKHYRSIPGCAHPDFFEVNEPIQIKDGDEMFNFVIVVLWAFVIALAIDEWYTRKYGMAADE